MTKKCLLLLFLTLAVIGSARAANIDLDDGPLIGTYNSPTFYSGGESGEYRTDEAITVKGTTTFGGRGTGYTLTVNSLITEGSATVNISSAGTQGVNVILNQLTPASDQTLTLNLNAGMSGDNRNTLFINALGVNGSVNATVGRYATFSVFGSRDLGRAGGSAPVAFNLNLTDVTSEASFAGGTTLHHGTIGGMGTIAVGRGMTISSHEDGGTATLRITGDLNIVTELGGTARGALSFGDSSRNTFIDFSSNGTLRAGEVTIGENVILSGTRGTFDVESLLVTEDFADASGVDMKVSGLTVVDAGVTYTVAGTGDVFAGGMDLFGTLTNSGATTITFGKANALSSLNVVDGTIVAAAGGLKIDYADIFITSEDIVPFTSLDASAAALNLGTSDVTVSLDGNSTTFAVDRGISIGNYRQLLGDVSLTGTGGSMTVTGSAVIGGESAGARVALNLAAGTTANFNKGLVLDRYGSLVALGNATVNLGSANANGDLNLIGDNALVGIPGQLTINSNGSTRKFSVSGHNNIAHGNVNAAGFDLTVNAGGMLNVASNEIAGLAVRSATVSGRLDLGTDAYNDIDGTIAAGLLSLTGDMVISSGGIVAANHDDARISTTGGRFTVEQGGSLIAETGTIYANGFSGIAINGSFTAGWDGTDVARLDTNSSVVIGSTGKVSVTKELAQKAAVGMSLINASGTITNNGNWDYLSMYGKMRFGLDAGDTQLIITDLSNQLIGTDEEKRRQALANLREMWGENQIRDDFGNIIYNVLEDPNYGPVPADSIAGNKNMGLFEALGNPDAKNVGLSTLEYMNGAYLTGITSVGMETSRTFVSDISNRTKVVRRQFVAAADITSSDAMASTAMNANYANRLWVDAHGLWQTGDGRQGFSGYSYDATGFTIGYDRALLCPLAIGFAGAYNDGDYEDKGAISSDSKIESFSAGGYATYSDLGGAYATLYAGYTYSDNDIRDLRQDPTNINGSNSWATAHFRTETINVGLNLGYDIRPTEGLVVTPSVGINYIHAKNSDYTSFLGDVGNQKIVNSRNRSIYIPLEMSVQYDTCLSNGGKLRLEVNGGYSYDLRESSMRGDIHFLGLTTPNIVGINGPTNSRHSYRLGGSARYAFNNYDIGARYDYIGKDGYDAHRVSATLGMSF
ncbi:MAG: autotransporter outer membrane beta-barrel domain-containing protein [Planctomycetaceae bacterium]|nr:autotransporter outer membrane beta-barrel domain-containing protein [Planctomycetaceae bacterium]